MSDLLAPLLISDEVDVFWCFVGLMQHTHFISSPSDHDMERQLLYLSELLRLMVPPFHRHLLTCGPGAMELLFAHRWILQAGIPRRRGTHDMGSVLGTGWKRILPSVCVCDYHTAARVRETTEDDLTTTLH